jgi:hypothetical protein
MQSSAFRLEKPNGPRVNLGHSKTDAFTRRLVAAQRAHDEARESAQLRVQLAALSRDIRLLQASLDVLTGRDRRSA